MKRIYKNIFLLFIFFTINIFSSKDAIIAPKKYKPAEMNLEITKVKLKEIEGTINEIKKELHISKKDLTVDTDDILFITEEKNKLRENFNFQKKDILNNENYVFSYKQYKDNIYLVHSGKEKIKNIFKINILFTNIPDDNISTAKYIVLPNSLPNSVCVNEIDGAFTSNIKNVGVFSGFPDEISELFFNETLKLHQVPINSTILLSNNKKKISVQHNNNCTLELILKKDINNYNLTITFTGVLDSNSFNVPFKFLLTNGLTNIGWFILFPQGHFNEKLSYIVKHIDFGTIKPGDKKNATGFIEFTNTSNKTYNIFFENNTLSQNYNLINNSSYIKAKAILSSSIIKPKKWYESSKITTIHIQSNILDSMNAHLSGIYTNTLYFTILQNKDQGGKF